MDWNNNLTSERFFSDFKQAVAGNADKLCRRSGLSHDDVRRFSKGELPTREQFAKLRRFYPQLKKYAFLFNEKRRIVGVRSDPIQPAQVPSVLVSKPVVAVATEKRVERVEKSVERAERAEKAEKVVLRVKAPPKEMQPTTIEVATEAPLPIPAPPSRLIVRQGKQKREDQYTEVETIDPGLAEILLKGNVRNRHVSQPLVESLARDILADAWITTHQGIALDSEYRLLDGQHRLLAIIKADKAVTMPVTYNVIPEAFDAIDLGGRPRSIADIARLSRGLKYGKTVIAACKTIVELGSPSIMQRWTKSEVDAILDIYQHDCEWAAGAISKAMGSAAVVAGLAYAYPTDKEKVADFAQKLASRVGMTSPMAALWNAWEREGVARPSPATRVNLAHMAMRCVWAFQRGEDLKKVYIRVSNIGDESGKNANTAYRHFRHLRLKLGLHE